MQWYVLYSTCSRSFLEEPVPCTAWRLTVSVSLSWNRHQMELGNANLYKMHVECHSMRNMELITLKRNKEHPKIFITSLYLAYFFV